MISPRTQRPVRRPDAHPLRGDAPGGLTIVHAPTERIASEAWSGANYGRLGWLRLDRLDRQPGFMVHSLCDALPDLDNDRFGSFRLEAPALAAAIDAAWHNFDTLVIEDTSDIMRSTAGRTLLTAFASAANGHRNAVAISHRRLSRGALSVADHVISARELESTSAAFVANGGAWCRTHLGEGRAKKLLRLTRRYEAVLWDLANPETMGWLDILAAAIDSSRSVSVLMDRLTAALIRTSSGAALEALATAVATGYWRESAGSSTIKSEIRPWLVPLTNGWHWLRPVWRTSLSVQLRRLARGQLTLVRPSARDHAPLPHRPRLEVGEPTAVAALPAPYVPTLSARMLGPFSITVDGKAVEAWEGKRGPAILKYLLTRPDNSCPRDQLMEVFWPDVDPQRARNRLQVAITSLRRSLRTATELPIVVFTDGNYRLSDELQIETDVAEFRRLLEQATQHDRTGDRSAALVAYEKAVALYVDDFLSETPYDEWTLFPRETLRISFIDTLDRMTAMYLETGDVDRCIATAQLALRHDPCREDAHRTLMECHARQGRSHLIARQYELCRATLANRLGTTVAPATVKLYRSLLTQAGLAESG